MKTEILSKGEFNRKRSIDYVTGSETYETWNDTGLVRHVHTGLEIRETAFEEYSIHPDDPNSAKGTCNWTKHYARGDWHADLETSITVRALKKKWKIDASLKASDADGIVMGKTWSESIPRDLV